ncbi:MAG: ATP-dependent helicase C-terminal domain-containing protein, partial [Paracoccaceae bacterium]
ALELALWGAEDLPFLTPPHPGTLAEARALLTSLGALRDNRITPHGRTLAALPLHPRLGHMLTLAGPKAAPLSALMADRDPLKGAPPDLTLRLRALADPRKFETETPWHISRPTLERIRDEKRRLEKAAVPEEQALSPAQMAALAYPDRIGLRRKGDTPRWLLSGGKGAAMEPGTPLAGARLIVATDLDGDTREAAIRQAIAITEPELRALYAPDIQWQNTCEWSKRDGRILARKQERFGAITLTDQPWPDAPPDAMARAALDGLRQIGLTFTPAARRLRARIELARAGGDTWPDCRDEALLSSAEDWLLPHLTRARTEQDLRTLDLHDALLSRLDWGQQAELDRLVPAHFTTPLGRRVPIDYDGDHPAIEIRLQEMFGVTTHPTVGQARKPLRVTLLSPGQKPIQVTMDIPNFWRTSYTDVRKDMRGQYPRHPWPEDPTEAESTLRAKPRGT